MLLNQSKMLNLAEFVHYKLKGERNMSKTGKYAKHQGKKAENKKIGIPPYAKDNPFKKAKEGTVFRVKKIDKTKEVRKKAEKEHWSWVF